MKMLHHTTVGMSIKRSPHLNKLYGSQNGLSNRIIADFLPDNFSTASSPSSSHFQQCIHGPSYNRIKLFVINHDHDVCRQTYDLPDLMSYWLYRFWPQKRNILPTWTVIATSMSSPIIKKHQVTAS